MPPIKIKLSLSSASLLSSSSSSTPSAADKGKGKAAPAAISTPEVAIPAPYTHAIPTPPSEWSSGSPAPIAGPSRLSQPTSLGPAFSPDTPTHTSVAGKTVPGQTPTSSAKKPKARSKPKSKLGRLSKPKRLSQSAPTRPTAIPPHVYSGPSTPLSTPGQMAPPPLPSYPFPGTTPSPVPESRYTSGLNSPGWDGEVKEEVMDGDDAAEGSPDPLATPIAEGDGQGTPYERGRTGVKWARLRKPLKELMGKIMIELRRRDEYALFSEPVNTDDFPTYLTIIGGADKMMDLSTMQNKVDNGDYRSMDQVEADLRMLVTAAQKFNPPGTVPYRSANSVLTHGLKHIERNRPLVLTPSPSPTREATGTPGRFSVDIETEPAEAKTVEVELPPASRIPLEMLDFPPNSLTGLAAGWNLNGGKQVYIKRELRARERFPGKWRHWDFDGTRSMVEMDDANLVLASGKPTKPRTVIDWKGLRREGAWWDWSGVGGAFGQPPVPFTRYPLRPTLGTREIGPIEWGIFPEIQTERKMMLLRRMNENTAAGLAGMVVDEDELFREHMRPTAPRTKQVKGRKEPGSGYLNTYDARRPGEWLRDMADGDVRGEAYRESVRRFLDGAIKGASGKGEGLRQYVAEGYNNGVLSSEIERATQRTLSSLDQLHKYSSIDTPSPSPVNPILPPDQIRAMAETSHARMTLRHILRPTNALDIAPLINSAEEFNLASQHEGMDNGLGWVAGQLEQLTKECSALGKKRKAVEVGDVKPGAGDLGREEKRAKTDRAGSSPLSTAPSSPPHLAESGESADVKPAPLSKVDGVKAEEARMKAVRLEILALCKFFPLTGLKPLSWAQAEKVLPANVRGLLSAPE